MLLLWPRPVGFWHQLETSCTWWVPFLLLSTSNLLDKLCRDTGWERAQSHHVVIPQAAPHQPWLPQPQHSPAPAHRHGGRQKPITGLCAGAVGSKQAQSTRVLGTRGSRLHVSMGKCECSPVTADGLHDPVRRSDRDQQAWSEGMQCRSCPLEASPGPTHCSSPRLGQAAGESKTVCVWVSGFSVSVACAQIKAALLEAVGGRAAGISKAAPGQPPCFDNSPTRQLLICIFQVKKQVQKVQSLVRVRTQTQSGRLST